MSNTEIILKRNINKTEEMHNHSKIKMVDITKIPNYIKSFNDIAKMYKELKAMGAPGPDLKTKEVRDQYDRLVKITQQLTQSYELVTSLSDTLEGNLELTKEIIEIQNLQFLLLEDINSKIDTIETVVSTSLPKILDEIAVVSDINKRIFEKIDVIDQIIDTISADIIKINQGIALNFLLIQVNRPYQFLTYASETCDNLNAALKAVIPATSLSTSNETTDYITSREMDEMIEFSTAMCEEGPTGLVYNLEVFYNEMSGNNAFSTSAIEDYINYVISNMENNQPASTSLLSFLATAVSSFSYISLKAFSTLTVCNQFAGKDIEKTIEKLSTNLDDISAQLQTYLNQVLGKLPNDTLLTSLYSTSWRKMDLSETIPSEEIRYEFSADQGNVIVGFETYIEDNKLFAKISQAKVVQNYIIDDEDDNGDSTVKTEIKDVTNIFFGSETFPGKSISNNDLDTPSAGINKDRCFNNDYLITKIGIYSEYEGSTFFFNYDAYACKYDAATGELSQQPEQATDANSSVVTTVVRGIANEFYQDSQTLPSGTPVTRLVDSTLSPLRGFYMFVQGNDIEIGPLIFMTDVFIDQQILLNE